MFVVQYRVAGFPDEFTSEEYPTQEIAQSHRDDIAGFEGVEYAIVCGRNFLTSVLQK